MMNTIKLIPMLKKDDFRDLTIQESKFEIEDPFITLEGDNLD